MNYRFKQALKEELNRLESLHLEAQTPALGIASFHYTRSSIARTMQVSSPLSRVLQLFRVALHG